MVVVLCSCFEESEIVSLLISADGQVESDYSGDVRHPAQSPPIANNFSVSSNQFFKSVYCTCALAVLLIGVGITLTNPLWKPIVGMSVYQMTVIIRTDYHCLVNSIQCRCSLVTTCVTSAW